MESIGYESCKADPDLCLKPETRSENGVQYYSYSLWYVDDILYIHSNADGMPQWLLQSLPLKLELGNPDVYLGKKFKKDQVT